MTPRARILLLEDDPNLGLIVEESLAGKDFEVTLCRDGVAGLAAYRAGEFDLCLVDVMMPEMDGFEFAAQVRREDTGTPLIFLTARALTEDRIEGFRLGCDDYVTKPFSMEELLLRIDAVLRRSEPGRLGSSGSGPVVLGSYRFVPDEQTLARDGDIRSLTDRETELLQLLCERMNDTLERRVALIRIWGDDSYHAGRSMDVFISRLRKYLQDDDRLEIKSVHGRGFKLLVRD